MSYDSYSSPPPPAGFASPYQPPPPGSGPPYSSKGFDPAAGSYPPLQGQMGYPPQGQMGYPPPYPPGQGMPPGYPVGYPPGPPSCAQYTVAPPQVVIIQQPVVTDFTFQEYSVRTTCPSCQSNVATQVAYEPGVYAWLWCIILACLGCIAGCCLVPFFWNMCLDAIHTCPNCNAHIGRYSRASTMSRRRY